MDNLFIKFKIITASIQIIINKFKITTKRKKKINMQVNHKDIKGQNSDI